MLENLTPLFDRFNDVLLKKFLGRLRAFFTHKWTTTKHEFVELIAALLGSLHRFFTSRDEQKKDEEQIKCKEIVEFFVFVVQEFTFDEVEVNFFLI